MSTKEIEYFDCVQKAQITVELSMGENGAEVAAIETFFENPQPMQRFFDLSRVMQSVKGGIQNAE